MTQQSAQFTFPAELPASSAICTHTYCCTCLRITHACTYCGRSFEFSSSAFAELSIIVHYSSNYVQSHSYCNTQCKKVRWGQVVTKSIHCHFPWSLLLCGCHLKVSRRRPPNRAQYSNILAFSNMPEGQDKSPVRYS